MRNKNVSLAVIAPILWLMLVVACKKKDRFEGIEKANISLGTIPTNISQGEEFILFKASYPYRSYFAATGVQHDDSTAFVVSTRSLTDDDYSPGGLVSRNINLGRWTTKAHNEKVDIFHENTAKLNVVSPNIYYIDKELHVIYLKQESFDVANIYIRKSFDRGASWSNEKKINTLNTFHVIMNNSVVVTRTGRIIVSAASTPSITENYEDQSIICYYSDDRGQTWYPSSKLVSNTPLMEPSIAQLNSGKLLMVIRSRLGKLLFSESDDNGTVWSPVKMSKIDAPASTSLLYGIGKKVALVWNHTKPGKHVFDRNPLSISLTADGKSWSSPIIIASEPGAMYSSPSLFKYYSKWVLLYNKSYNAGDYDIVYKLIDIKE